MDNIRQEKISKAILKEMGELITPSAIHLEKNEMATVTKVRVSPDLSIARIYVSVFAKESERKKQVIEFLNAHTSTFRGALGNRLNHFRKVPELFFHLDDSLDYQARIEDLLNK